MKMFSVRRTDRFTTKMLYRCILSSLYFTLSLLIVVSAHQEPTVTTSSSTKMGGWNHPPIPSLYHHPSLSFPTTATKTTIRTKSSSSSSSLLLLVPQLRGGGGGGGINRKASSSPPPPPQRRPTLLVPPPDGTVDPTSHVINLIKTIIGAGVLGIPAGMVASFATASDGPMIILGRSLFLLVLIGLLAANGFNNIGQICRCTNSISYAQAWNRTVSETTTILPNMACIMVTFCTLVTYSMVLSDTIPSLLRPILEQAPLELLKRGLPYVTRTNVLLVLTTTMLLPLCLLQSLSALAPFSFVGICGMIYTAMIMTLRYFDQSYSTTGRFLSTIEPNW